MGERRVLVERVTFRDFVPTPNEPRPYTYLITEGLEGWRIIAEWPDPPKPPRVPLRIRLADWIRGTK